MTTVDAENSFFNDSQGAEIRKLLKVVKIHSLGDGKSSKLKRKLLKVVKIHSLGVKAVNKETTKSSKNTQLGRW